MQIHVARNSAQLGVFAPEEIIAGLQSGRFLASDLASYMTGEVLSVSSQRA